MSQNNSSNPQNDEDIQRLADIEALNKESEERIQRRTEERYFEEIM